jgi:hypothetical protein
VVKGNILLPGRQRYFLATLRFLNRGPQSRLWNVEGNNAVTSKIFRGVDLQMKFPVLLTVICLLLGPQAIAVCSVPQPRLVCAEYFASNVVVEATLVRTRVIHEKDQPELVRAHLYRLRVNHILRGETGESIRVYEENDSGRAAFDWTLGRKYLLFLLYSPEGKFWALDGCGNSGLLNQAKAALSEISSIQSRHDEFGLIQGMVSLQTLSVPEPGVRVEALGGGRHYVARTNEKGEFQIKVPTGRYIVRGAGTGFRIGAADLSYENPRKLQVEPGGCVQIQLVGVERFTSSPPENH